MKKFSLPAIAIFLCLSMAAGSGWEGRVVDMGRAAVAGAKVTLHPQGITTITDGSGIYRLSGVTGIGNQAPRPSQAGHPPAGLRMGFLSAPELPALDLSGRRIRPEGNRWVLIAPLLPSYLIAPALPLAKSASALPLHTMAGASILTAEKPGYQTASIPLAAGEAIPDIILAPGLNLSRPAQLTETKVITVPALPRTAGFSGSTSTELPNVVDPVDSAGGITPVVFSQYWHLATESGTPVYVRPHAYFPRYPEKAAMAAPDTISDDSGLALIGFGETANRKDDYQVLRENSVEFVNLTLWNKAPGKAFGTMRCLQFPGPIRAGLKYYVPTQGRYPHTVRTDYTGKVPDLDTCGKVAGKVAWKGPGPMPELWIGMPGTELFTAVAPDGAFLSTDLPPGKPPVVLVRVDRSDEGAAVPSAYHVLEGLEVISGQTSVLDSIGLAGE